MGRVFNPWDRSATSLKYGRREEEGRTAEFARGVRWKSLRWPKFTQPKHIMLGGDLQHELQMLDEPAPSLNGARAYMMDQVLTLRDAWFNDTLKQHSRGPDPMDF